MEVGKIVQLLTKSRELHKASVGSIKNAQDMIRTLRDREEKLTKALEFYADQTNWYPSDKEPHLSAAEQDAGERAREILEDENRDKS